MATLEELSFADRLFVRTYRWRRIDPVPWAAMTKPLSQARLALVSSAGLVPPGHDPFDPGIRGGDWSFRTIPDDVDLPSLVDTHRSRSFDHSGMAADRNVAFPLERLHELRSRGRIGASAPRHLSLMGSITAPGRLITESAPRAAELLLHDQVDVALLVPV